MPSSEELMADTAEHIKQDNPKLALTGKIIGSVMVLLALAAALDLYQLFGLVLIDEQLLAIILGLSLAMVFVLRPFRHHASRRTLPWYDAVAAIMAFGACAYVAFNYAGIVATLFEKPFSSVAAATIIVASVIECLRRTAGMMLFGFTLFFLAFGLVGHLVPGHFQGREVAVDRLLIYIGMDSNGIIGLPIAVVVSIVVPFVFFGNLLNASGGANFFTEISAALMGRYRGGSAKIAIVASWLFGSISGSAVANVVSTGVITIPMMKKSGYSAERAAAIEAVASTGGQIMPPMMGAAAFMMAEFLQLPYTDIILAALIPASLYYISLFIQADLYAAKEGIRPLDEMKYNALEVISKGWLYVAPFVVLIVGMFNLNLQPQAAAMYAAGLIIPIALAFGYRGVRMHWTRIVEVLGDTGIAVAQLLIVSAMAGVVIGVLNITGFGFALTHAIIKFSGGNLAIILLLAGAISIVLGMGMPTVGVYLLLATLVAPSMVEAGVTPLAAHMFAFYFGVMSMITPPVAAAAFAGATIAKADFVKTGIAAVIFGWPAYIMPFIFAMSPEMLWQGTPLEIIRIFVFSVAGVWLVSAGWIGFFGGMMNTLWRLAFVLAGIACFVPGSAISNGYLINLAGMGVGIALVASRLTFGRVKVANV